MEFYSKEEKDKNKNLKGKSYILDTPDPDKITPTGAFKKDETRTPTSKDKETPTPGENDEHLISENLSEISANDYGFFNLKIVEEVKSFKQDKDDWKNLKKKKTSGGEEGAFKFNLVNHLGNIRENPRTGEMEKIANNKLDLITHLAKEENEYILFDIVNVKEITSKSEANEHELREKVILIINFLGSSSFSYGSSN